MSAIGPPIADTSVPISIFLVESSCRAFWPKTTTIRLISVTPTRGSQRPSLKVKNAGALHLSKLRQVTTPLPRGGQSEAAFQQTWHHRHALCRGCNLFGYSVRWVWCNSLEHLGGIIQTRYRLISS